MITHAPPLTPYELRAERRAVSDSVALSLARIQADRLPAMIAEARRRGAWSLVERLQGQLQAARRRLAGLEVGP